MYGVTILSEYECSIDRTGIIAACIPPVMACVMFITLAALMFIRGIRGAVWIVFMAAIVTVLSVIAVRDELKISKLRWKEYDVKLSEEVSYIEFTRKYTVLYEEDGIFRVRER